MKKKLLTVVILLLTLAVLAVLFVPKTTRVTAKLENDNAEILQVDTKSFDFLLLEDKGKGMVHLTICGELFSYEALGPIYDPMDSAPKGHDKEYPSYQTLWRYDAEKNQTAFATIFFDKKCSCFILMEDNVQYRFVSDIADEATVKMVEDFVG